MLVHPSCTCGRYHDVSALAAHVAARSSSLALTVTTQSAVRKHQWLTSTIEVRARHELEQHK